MKVSLDEFLNTPLTIPDRAWTFTSTRIDDKVSILVGILLEQVIALPLNGTQCNSDIVVSIANILYRRDFHSWGTLTAGVYLIIPCSTDMLFSLVSSLPPIVGVRGNATLPGGGIDFGSGGSSRFSLFR